MRRQVRRVHGFSLLYVRNTTLLLCLCRLVQTSFKRIRTDGSKTRSDLTRKKRHARIIVRKLCEDGKVTFSSDKVSIYF